MEEVENSKRIEAVNCLKSDIEAAQLLGCSLSTARIMAVNIIKEKFGEDFSMYLTEKDSANEQSEAKQRRLAFRLKPSQQLTATPTDLGSELYLSCHAINKMLLAKGLQTAVEIDGKKRWRLTEEGKKYADHRYVTAPDGTKAEAQKIMWKRKPTLELLRSHES
jgi:hypothetical protein